jgi:hypothetical protein
MVTPFSMDADEQERAVSKFNEAFLKMSRINKLQDTINLCSINPLLYNHELNVFNYQIMISCCNGLLKECYGKMKDEEKKDAIEMKDAIEKMMKKYPVHENIKDIKTGEYNIKYNEQRWRILNDWIFKYDLLVRDLISKTGYDSPNKSDFDDDDF